MRRSRDGAAPSSGDKRMADERTNTAYHEAGHAIVAHYFEWLGDDKKVTIIPNHDEGWLGLCEHHSPLSEFNPDELQSGVSPKWEQGQSLDDREKEVNANEAEQARRREETERVAMVALAGGVAEKTYDPDSDLGYCANDNRDALDLIELLINSRSEPGGTFVQAADDTLELSEYGEAYWGWLRARTKALLDHRWDHVKLVAKALLEKDELMGDEIADLIWNHIEDERARG